MGAPYITLPGGARIPSFVKDRICSGSAYDFNSLMYREWPGASVAGVRGFAFSEDVPQGFYWWVIAISGFNNDVNTRVVNFHKIPSQFPHNGTLFQGASNLGPTQGSVRIDKGGFQIGSSANFTQIDNANVPFALPPGWALMAWEETSAGPAGGAHVITLRAAFFQVPIGLRAPGM
jgi:hypothetical protein